MSSLKYYLSVRREMNRTMADWSKYSWGVYFGVLFAGMFVDSAILDLDADSIGPGKEMAMWFAPALIVSYALRKRPFDKKLAQLWETMSPADQEKYNNTPSLWRDD